MISNALSHYEVKQWFFLSPHRTHDRRKTVTLLLKRQWGRLQLIHRSSSHSRDFKCAGCDSLSFHEPTDPLSSITFTVMPATVLILTIKLDSLSVGTVEAAASQYWYWWRPCPEGEACLRGSMSSYPSGCLGKCVTTEAGAKSYERAWSCGRNIAVAYFPP